MIYGKIVGALLGLMAGGIPGLILGGLIGHAFDRGLGKALLFASPENVERIRNSFFETTFLLLGYLAKVDGRISQAEIDHTEQLFVQMGLDTQQRQRAIELFRRGSSTDFQLEPVIGAFTATCGPQPQLRQTLLLFLISQAHADAQLEPEEHAALVRIAGLFGMGAPALERLLRMAQAQSHFHQQGSGAAPRRNDIEEAYAALGVPSSIDDKGLKKAYRKLMSENHPDKLIAKGVPENLLKQATERAQEIQAAYEMIRKQRGLAR